MSVRLALCSVAVAVLWLAVGAAVVGFEQARAAGAPAVPAQYEPIYNQLKRVLDDAAASLPAQSTGAKPHYATDLLVANSNRGPALLVPETMEGVKLSLDRFKEMGIGAVKFALQYPLLRPGFPRGDEYLEFYKGVVREAHARGLKVMPHVSVLFADTPFSGFQDIYRGLDFETFKREYADMVRRVEAELRPDYLTLLTEPDTHARLTGIAALTDPRKIRDVIEAAVADLPRGGTLVGAGSGSWSGPAYAEQFAQIARLDYICIHVYPVNARIFANIAEMAAIAHAHGKQAVIDEAWLYKTIRPGGGDNVAAASEIFRKDVYAFWQPLDQEFMDVIDARARKEGIALVSFFWSSLFFASLDYDPELDRIPYRDVTKRLNRSAYRAMQDGRFSPTGEHYRALIARP